jgi:hypothetical protein
VDKKLLKEKSAAIVAYKQPITRVEIDKSSRQKRSFGKTLTLWHNAGFFKTFRTCAS